MPFVPVPRRNPETSHCEVRKSVRDSSGVPRTLEVVAVVKGVARAQRAIDDFTKHLTEEEKKKGIFFAGNTRRVGSVENEANIDAPPVANLLTLNESRESTPVGLPSPSVVCRGLRQWHTLLDAIGFPSPPTAGGPAEIAPQIHAQDHHANKHRAANDKPLR
jgi:hypothetical protein